MGVEYRSFLYIVTDDYAYDILSKYIVVVNRRNKYMIVICCYLKLLVYLWTRPEPSPPANFNTSSMLTMLKSPSIECFKQLAATANSIVDCAS